MIDKKGKIFGIINALDLVTFAIVILVAVFVFKKLTTKAEDVTNLVTIRVYAEEVSDFVANVVQVGDRLEDEGKNIYLGQISEVNVEDGYKYVEDADGNLIKSKKEGYKSIEVVSQVRAQITENGITIGGNKYGVGHSLTIRAGKGKIYAKVSAIDKVE